MKKITFPELTSDKWTLPELLKAALDNPGAGGITVTEMKARLDIHEAVDAMGADRELYVENGQWEKLKQLYEAMPWAVVHRDLTAVHEAIRSAEGWSPQKGAKAKAA